MQDIQKFRKWLDSAFDDIDEIFKPPEEVSEWTYCQAGRIVYVASKQARRLGAPELVHKVREFPDGGGFCQRDEALDALGRMLAWCREYEMEKLATLAYLTVEQAATCLQVSKDVIYDLCKSGNFRAKQSGGPSESSGLTWIRCL